MKILYVITKSNWGGAQRHVYDLATSMKDRGHDVSVALGGDGILRKRLEDAGIYTHSISDLQRDVSFGDDIKAFKQLFSIIKFRKPDIVHLHSPKAAGLGALSARILGIKKIIYTVHGWAFNENRPISQKILIAIFSWITLLLSKTTILISEAEYSQTLRFPGTSKKIALVKPGIAQPIFMSVDGSKQTISKAIGMELTEFNKKTVIGTIAELHPNKGLHYFIQALAPIIKSQPNIVSVIIGEGESRSQLTSLIEQNELQKNVFMPGYIENASDYLKAFSLFALSSQKEGLPYVLIEAGYAGLPVVSTTVGGIPEIIEDMKSGVLIQSKNIPELSHALSFMIEHPEERKKYGSSLKEKVIKEFSLDRMIEETEKVYTK
jgi:glycosyltransferase involved in cell wall biosynthesis